ncbi:MULTISPECIES: HAMP domain-containing sensor histidine kinase [unclassified Parafrankia]|uniref:sensor histidine kinase n=1 Tax=unclassified Parafrankia TaxID=2994368 RepID=UPI000DA431BF|nr:MULTISPECIES: HAMP domain-containing sensor histidine kinase [unclassified Parafrankia]TCJ38529.1 HAMP domain-containing histidine kinase [Parafrankia sp. BMG5.11]CAI7978440.1 two-component system, OmpR family, sensor kinase [Frankia sp. Hr75.2]SQD98857.1 Integral membrane sensor signal transduction histidine kinase [Parafrankia sp. Ea1.12]
MTLRLKLMLGLVALTATGLILTIVATVVALRGYLVDRVDVRLRAVEQVARLPLAAVLAGAPTGSRPVLERAIAPTDYVVEARRTDGEILRVAGPADRSPPLLAEIATGKATGEITGETTGTTAPPADGTPFTVTHSGERYRAVLDHVPGGEVLIAQPLATVRDTLRRLVVAAAVAALVVLAAIATLAWLLLTRGLRPLRVVASTASAIAAGDLSRRVPEGPPRSETGQLSRALNIMLGQIQAAFTARVASQNNLRRFAADASHELRTPLTSIRGYVDLLRAGMVPPAETDDTLRRVAEETARMQTLVDDLLYLAHLDELRPRDRVDVDLVTIAEDAAANLRAVDPARPVTVEVEAGPEAGRHVLGDPDALRQLLGNLLTNARVHTPAGTTVTVRVTGWDAATPAQDRAAVLAVEDGGPGMPPEVARHVFDRFYRAAGSRARGRSGSGLGLSIVAATAAAHGGRAEVSSTPEGGTTFRVYLPGGVSDQTPADQA